MKKILVGLALLLGGLGAWALASRNDDDDRSGSQRYRTEAVQRGPIVAAVSSTGTVTPTTTVIVGSQLSGQVVEILADFNSQVKAGQVMARLNRDTLMAKRDAARADLDQARAARKLSDAQSEKVQADIRRAEAQANDMRAQLTRAEAQLADAEATYERQQGLKARGIASEVTLQTATTQKSTLTASKRSAEAQIMSSQAQIASLRADLKIVESQKLSGDAAIAKAEAQVRQIEVDLSNAEIRSPVDGVVVQRNVELGQTVAASLQAPTLFLVAQDLTRIEIYVNVDEADVGRVKVGQEVEFTVNAYAARTFKGRVKQIRLGSQTVQNVVIYTTIVEVQNEDLALLPGMTANLRVFTERRNDVLRVPNAALRWQPAGVARPAGTSPVSTAPPNPAEGGDAGPFVEGGQGGGRGGSGGGNAGAALLASLKAQLDLSADQVKTVEKLGREMRTAIQAAGDNPEARREAARAARQRFSRGLEDILTVEQKAKYQAIREERRNRNAPSGDAGMPGRVHVLDTKGNPRAITLRIGATDGAFSEVLYGEIKPGDTVITGALAATKPGGATGGFRFGF